MNINKAEFKFFIRNIVANHVEEELDLYDIDGEEMINTVLEGETKDNIDLTDSPEFKFGFGEVVESIKFIGIVIGTLKTLNDFAVLFRNRDPETTELEDAWRSHLIDEGLAEEKAEAIIQKFGDDLRKNFIKK